MRKLALAIATALTLAASTGAIARGFNPFGSYSGVDTNNSSNVGAQYSGSSNVSSISHSSTRGRGYSVNGGGASSHQYGAGSAKTGENNSYEAKVDLRNETSTYSYSDNRGNARGYSNNKAEADSQGRLGGNATSDTFSWEVDSFFGIPLPWTYDRDGIAHAHSSACGHLSASSDSHSATGNMPQGRRGRHVPGDGEVNNISWGDASLYLNGHAATTSTAASTLSDATLWTDTGSVSRTLWGNGHVHGTGDAEASARLRQNGNVLEVPCRNGCGGDLR